MTIKVDRPLFGQAPSLINYNFDDLVFRTGYINYYVCKGNNGTFMVVTNPIIQSELIATVSGDDGISETINSKTYYLKASGTADLTFPVPVNLDGDMFFNMPIGMESEYGGGSNRYMLARLSAFHYDGSSETAIGSEVTSEEYEYDFGNATNDGTRLAAVLFRINTSGTVHFKAGESLRVKFEMHTTGSLASGRAGIAHDPLGRLEKADIIGDRGADLVFDNDAISTQFIWSLPHKTNVTII